MAPRLSIVVPFFNVERYIADCLRSLQRQAFEDFEAVLVDDGSTDGSAAVAADFVRRDPRFRLVRQENRGLGPARNAGVHEAGGDLLTFVDSDDLVPRYAYERLVGSLDVTGSDFAAGDARRFNTLGVWESYAHRLPFEKERLSTHISENPVLALDRMAWNKVYRRDFWDATGLEFPAMLYEDYPVTIKGHVRAKQVDILSDPVYYWRERDGGELSITQRHWEIANLRDRVTSAEMVLELLEQEAPYALEIVQGHLFHIDVSALAAAVQEHPADDVPLILELADRLAGRIPPAVRRRALAFERVQHHLLVSRKIDELCELVRYRADHGTSAKIVLERGLRTRYFVSLPFLGDREVGVPKDLYRIDPSEFELEARLEDAEWVDGMLNLEITAAPRMLAMGEGSTVSVWLQDGGGQRIPCQVTRHHQVRPHIGRDLSGLRTVVNPVALETRSKGFWTIHLRIKTETGLTREGTLKSTAPTRGRWVDGRLLDESVWLQPRIVDGDFGVWVGWPPQWVTHCSDFGAEIEVVGGIRRSSVPERAEFVLVRSGDREFRQVVDVVPGDGGVHAFSVRVPVCELAVESEHDSPVEELTAWVARLSVDGDLKPLACHPDFTGAVATARNRSVIGTRNPRGMLIFLEGHAHPLAMDVTWVDRSRLEIVGLTHDPGSLSPGVLLRRYVTPADVVEAPVDLVVEEGTFRLQVDVDDLIDRVARLEGLVHSEGRLSTPWHIVSADPDRSLKIAMARSLAAHTARPRVIRGHTVRVQFDRGGVVRLLID